MKSSRFGRALKKIEYSIMKNVRNLFRIKKEIFKKVKDYTTIIDTRNLFKLRKETNNATIKDITNFFRLKKENKAIKDRIIRDCDGFVLEIYLDQKFQ